MHQAYRFSSHQTKLSDRRPRLMCLYIKQLMPASVLATPVSLFLADMTFKGNQGALNDFFFFNIKR